MIKILLLLLIILLNGCQSEKKISRFIQNLGGELSKKDNFKVTINHQVDEGDSSLFYMEGAKDSGEKIKVTVLKNVSKEEFNIYLKKQEHLIGHLYSTTKAPYPGMITNTRKCNQVFTSSENSKGRHYSKLYANNRYVFGICDKAQAAFSGEIFIAYCENKRASFHFEYFYSKHGVNKELDLSQFKCL